MFACPLAGEYTAFLRIIRYINSRPINNPMTVNTIAVTVTLMLIAALHDNRARVGGVAVLEQSCDYVSTEGHCDCTYLVYT